MQYTELTKEEKNWAMGTHLASLLSLIIPFGSIIGPLMVWLMKKNESDFIDSHGKESVNFQISTTIYTLIIVLGLIFNIFSNIETFEQLDAPATTFADVMAVLGPIFAWILGLIFIGIFVLIMIIVASISASSGKTFKYPLSIRFIR